MNRDAIIYVLVNIVQVTLHALLRSIWGRHIVADSQSITRLLVSVASRAG